VPGTKKIQTAALLKEATENNLFFGAIENSGIPNLICDTGGEILFANKAAAKLFGYEDGLEGLDRSNLFCQEDPNAIDPGLNEELYRSESIAVKKNGERFSCEMISSVFTYENNRFTSLVVSDISENSLKKINERFYFATQATSDIIWDWDLLTNSILWAENFTKILGHELPADSTLPLNYCINNFHPDDREKVVKSLEEAIQNADQKKWECEFRYKRSDGSWAFVHDQGYIIRDENKKAVRMIGAMHDNSEQKYQQDILALELKIFETSSTPGTPFNKVINALLEGIEAMHPQMFSSVLLLKENNTIEHFAAPRLPAAYVNMINGLPIGPVAGSCGTAMYKKQPVIVSDVDHDPLWEPYREVAAQFGLKACWSVPLIHSNGKVIGSFAIYYHYPKQPPAKEWNTILRITNLVRLLFENNISIEQIRLSNERYDIVTNATHDLIWDWNLETNELYREPNGLQKVYGYSSNEPIRNINDWLSRIHQDDLAKVQKAVYDILNTKEENIFDLEYRFKGEDGNYVHIYDRGFILRNAEGKAYRMIGAAQDVTDKKRLEEELLNYQKAISLATINIQEKERAEIGKELHDNVNQVLTTTKLYLDLAAANPELKDEMIIKSSKNIMAAISEIRQLSRSLILPSLGDLGLADSIEDLVEDINATKKLHASFARKNFDESVISESQKLALFRIVQEGLNNVMHHSEATEVTIELTDKKNWIELRIADDGKGFDPAQVRKGAGLNNIRNRVYLSNGTFTIDTRPGKGCILVVELAHQYKT
jgi:PAS domain S-box-containing protein